jgi:hypothetical protein
MSASAVSVTVWVRSAAVRSMVHVRWLLSGSGGISRLGAEPGIAACPVLRTVQASTARGGSLARSGKVEGGQPREAGGADPEVSGG